MKKRSYKHKLTGNIFYFVEGDKYAFSFPDGVGSVCIPVYIIEGSSDWAKYLLTTEDGVDKYENDDWWVVLTSNTRVQLAWVPYKRSMRPNPTILDADWIKRFDSKDALDRFIEANRPVVQTVIRKYVHDGEKIVHVDEKKELKDKIVNYLESLTLREEKNVLQHPLVGRGKKRAIKELLTYINGL